MPASPCAAWDCANAYFWAQIKRPRPWYFGDCADRKEKNTHCFKWRNALCRLGLRGVMRKKVHFLNQRNALCRLGLRGIRIKSLTTFFKKRGFSLRLENFGRGGGIPQKNCVTSGVFFPKNCVTSGVFFPKNCVTLGV